jgi:hypothetical protein
MRLPFAWNRSRATAAAIALLLHVLLAWWLLALRFNLPNELAPEPLFEWLPLPAPPPEAPPPVETETPPPRIAPNTAPPLTMPVPALEPAAPRDWSRTARDVAKDMTAESPYRRLDEAPKAPPGRPSELYPPSIFDKPLPRVGKTVTTAEGETIIWVSDYCYVSISSRTLTQKDIHDGRKGARICVLAEVGEKKARDDLFDAIKRPPPPQEPGCNKEGIGQSCAR